MLTKRSDVRRSGGTSKIDVEGAEAAVLRGARNVLGSGAVVVCEVHPAQLVHAGSSVAELQEIARSAGTSWIPFGQSNDQGIFHVVISPR